MTELDLEYTHNPGPAIPEAHVTTNAEARTYGIGSLLLTLIAGLFLAWAYGFVVDTYAARAAVIHNAKLLARHLEEHQQGSRAAHTAVQQGRRDLAGAEREMSARAVRRTTN